MAEFSKSYKIIENEETIVKYWNDNNIFQKSIDQNNDNKTFIFYDGPPFATGLPHAGHILAGYIKDTICRWATINGFKVPRRAGWDTHGLPIEFEIEKKFGIKTKDQVKEFGIDKYNEACREIVMTYAGEWKTIMNRFGRWVDFDNDYKTMDIEFMSKVWGVFSKIYEKGLIYEGVKIMPYSVACTTPLSNFEASNNYQRIIDRTVIVKFKVKTINDTRDVYILSWTTTPWTLPSHYCLCVNKDLIYCLIKYEEEFYYICKTRIEFLKEKLKVKDIQVISEHTGFELIGLEYIPPYNFNNQSFFKVIADNFVSDSAGTGIVHIAPAFGDDDYRVSLENNLITKELNSLYMHIDDSGNGVNCGQFNKISYSDINKMVLKELQNNKLGLVIFDYDHEYPFCWRSDTKLIYKAVKCWFLNVDSIKNRMVEINKGINWIPEHIGRTRFNNWLENTRDWCLSRNRYWGTPIPVWRADDGSIIVIKSKEHLEELSKQKINDLHRHNIDHIVIELDGKKYMRDETVLDCWFESGSVPFASPITGYPADFIAEGLDQTRGWFYTLLVIGTILENQSPFKNVIVNGLVLAEDGKKMSKRLKNYTDPLDVVNEYGADAYRYYLIMSGASMASELRFKNSDVKEVLQTVIIPLTNSLSFFEEYYKLYTLKNTFKNIESNLPFDKWILTKTYDFLSTYTTLLNDYKINPINDLLVKYIDDLNNNYIKFNRDIIKGKDEDDNSGIKCLKALNTLQKVLTLLCVYLSPILPFFTESMHSRLNLKDINYESVHLSNLKDYDINQYNIIDDDTKMISNLLKIVEMVRQIRNTNDIQLTKPLKNIIIYGEDDNINLLKKVESYIVGEGNIMEIEWKNWEATTYEYKYTINMRNAGTLFKAKRKDFEQFMTTKTQEELENLYNDRFLLYENIQIDSNLVTVHQLIPTSQEDGYKISEDLRNKLKIKLNIIMDDASTELYIAKLIATTFQKLRKLGGFHVYDNLRLVMKTNKYTSLVMKHQEYICKTTRVNIEIIDDIINLKYDFYKEMTILDEICDMYLINKN